MRIRNKNIGPHANKLRLLRLGFFSIFLTLISLFSSSSSFAATLVWDGGGATQNWGDAANWNPDAMPNSGDSLVFDGALSLKHSVANLSFNIASLTIQSNFTSSITIVNSVVVNSSVTIPTNARIVMNGGYFRCEGSGGNPGLDIYGTLEYTSFPSTHTTVSVLGDILVENTGAILIGSSTTAIASNINALLLLDTAASAGNADLIIGPTGKLKAYGYGFNTTAFTSNSISGGTSFTVSYSSHVSTWKAGDTIVIGKTTRNNLDECEKRIIASVSGNTINVDTAFSLSHAAGADVTNLTRNVIIRSENATYFGSIQSAAQNPGDFHLVNVEISRLGYASPGTAAITFSGGNSKGTIQGSSVYESSQHGILVDFSSSSVVLDGNIIYKSSQMGIYLNQAKGAQINNNHILGNQNHGVNLTNMSDRNTLSGNRIYSNVGYGIQATAAHDNNIIGNSVFSNASAGLRLESSSLPTGGKNNVELNNITMNFTNGIEISQSHANFIGDNTSASNGSSGFGLTSTRNNVLRNNQSTSNQLRGFDIFNSSHNIFSANRSSLNVDNGIHLQTAINNTFLSETSYGNGNFGYQQTQSQNNVFANTSIGWNGGSSFPNSVDEVMVFNSGDRAVFLNSRINPSAGDFNLSGLNLLGNSIISMNHNQAGGVTRIYGDYEVTPEDELNLSFASLSYPPKATTPIVVYGLDHTLIINSVSTATALTQLITVEYESDNLWHVTGSVSGGMGTFSGNQANTGFPTASPQFFLSFTQAATPQVDDEIAFGLIGGSQDTNMQKQLLFGPSGINDINGQSRLNIPVYSTFTAIGAPGFETRLDWLSAGNTYYSIVSSGTMQMQYAIVEHTNLTGLQALGNSSVSLSSVTFNRSMGGTYLSPRDLNSNATFYSVIFNDSDSRFPFNVQTLGNTSNLNWNFVSWSGSRGGPTYENDPSNRVHWQSVGGSSSTTNLNPYFSFVGIDIINVFWDNLGTNYVALLSTSPSFSVNIDSVTLAYNNRNYTNLSPNTSYYFRVKVATESDVGYSPVISTITQTGSSNFVLGYSGLDKVATMQHDPVVNFSSDTTVEFWFKRYSTSLSNEYLLSKDNPMKTTGWAVHLAGGGGVRFQFFSGPGLQSNVQVLDTNWHHIAITRQAGDGWTRLYQDGVEVNQGYLNSFTTNVENLKIGNSADFAQDFSGLIDEVRVWDSVRSGTVIQTVRFAKLIGNEANLTTYFDFDDAAGQIIDNKVPGKSDGYLGTNTSPDGNDPFWLGENIPGFGAPVDTTAPTTHILLPLQNSSYTVTQLMNISGTAQDNQTLLTLGLSIQRFSDGQFFHRITGYPGYWSYSETFNSLSPTSLWNFPGNEVTWTTGTYQVRVRAEDGSFNVGFASSTFFVVMSTDSTPPSISINYPVHGSSYTASNLTSISGTATDNEALSGIGLRIRRHSDNFYWDQYLVNWSSAPVINQAYGLYAWNYYPPYSAWSQSGPYTMDAIAIDLAQNRSTATITIQLDNGNSGTDTIPPTIEITHPVNQSTHSPTALALLSGTANDNIGVTEIMVKVQDLTTFNFWNGSSFGAPSETYHWVSPNYYWSFGGISSGSWVNGRMYALTARVRDAAANFTFRTSSFTINSSNTGDTIPPSIQTYFPTNGGLYDIANYSSGFGINGYASDNVGIQAVLISLRKDSSSLYYDGSTFSSASQIFLPAYGFSYWNYVVPSGAFSNGSFTLVAVATDTSGLSTAIQVPFTITGVTSSTDTTAPTASILFPANNGNYSNAFQLTNLSGTAQDNVGVTETVFSLLDDTGNYWNGYAWSSASEYWSFVYGSSLSWTAYMPSSAWKNGNFTMRLRVRDAANNVAFSSAIFTVSGLSSGGSGDTTPPNIFVYNPYPNAIGNPYSFTYLNGRAEDPFGIQEVKYSLRNNNTGLYWNQTSFASTLEILLDPGITNGTSSSLDWNVPIPFNAYTNGEHTLFVRAKDPSNNTSTSYSSFTVTGASSGSGDVTPPTLSILYPVNNQTYTSSQLSSISGTAFDTNSVSNINVRVVKDSTGEYWNGAVWSSSPTWLTAYGTTNWTFPVPVGMWSNGDFTISVRAFDIANNQTTETVDVTVAGTGSGGTPPTVEILTPQNTQTLTVSNLTTISGTAADDTSVSYVRVRITDMNTLMDWNPTLFYWTSNVQWFNATLTGNNWTVSQLPYWGQGHYRVMAQAEDSTALISVAASHEFFLQTSGGGTDFTPPGEITLTASPGNASGRVNLSWTAVGDDGNVGTASLYRIKYSPTAPISTEVDWTNALDVSLPPTNQTLPSPSASGTPETFTVQNLSPGIPYFWAVRARDEAGNGSPLSNSPLAAANGGCSASGSDGQGSVSMSPSSLAENTSTLMSIVFNVGANGMTSGGKILVSVPSGWSYPQTYSSASPGYVSVTSNNPLVTLTLTLTGNQIQAGVTSGTLNSGDQVTFQYQASPYCGVNASVPFQILSQASSCGQPVPIATQPTVAITAGPASWIGFESYETFSTINQITTVDLIAKNQCGNPANMASNKNVEVAAVFQNFTTYTYDPDANAQLSEASNLASPFQSQTVVFPSGQSTKRVYYRLSATPTNGNSYIRIRYADFQNSAVNSENSTRIIPLASGAGLSGLSVDSGTQGSLAQVTITPDNDNVNDQAFINFQLGDPNISWRILISNDGFSTNVWDYWGYGSPARRAWDGKRNNYPYDVVPAGTYQVKVLAAGTQDTSLSVIVSAVGITGTVQNSVSNLAVNNVSVNVFGPMTRFTTSDNAGAFSLVGLTNGTYQLRLEKQGYIPYTTSFNVTGGSQNLGTLSLVPQAEIVFSATRSNTANEVWGFMRAVSGTEDIQAPIHYLIGQANPDNGFSGQSPKLFLRSGVSYNISAQIPGYTIPSIQRTFTPGESYTWTPTTTEQSYVYGTIFLSNGLSNTTGIHVNLASGLDTNSDGNFDLGVPSFFQQAYIPPYETQTNYQFPGVSNGTYLVEMFANGFSPSESNVSISGASSGLNFTLSQGGSVNVSVTVSGNTLPLNTGSGTFPVTLRLESTTNAFNSYQTGSLSTHASSTSGTITFTGVPNGTYVLYTEPLQGFSKVPSGPVTNITVAGGVGSATINFTQNSGSFVGTVTLPGGSVMGSLQIQLSNGTQIFTTPTISGNQFTFSNLGSGNYQLGVFDPVSNGSYFAPVLIANGQATNVNINLAGVTTYSASGIVQSIAAPPYQNLSAISALSTQATFYTSAGTTLVSGLRVEALLINPDNTVDPLPTISSRVLNPTKLKTASIDINTGAWSISGLELGKSYKLRLNPDFNNDETPEIPLEERIVSLTANRTGENFTIRDGAQIAGTLTAPSSDTGHLLNITLTDTDLNAVIQSANVTLSGTSGNFTFTNLRPGRYLIRTEDLASPAQYAAAPQHITIDTYEDQKTVSINLTNGAVIRGKLSNRLGQLITSSNFSTYLPSQFKIRLFSPGNVIEAEGPAADGTFTANVLPDIDYDVRIQPPLQMSEQDRGKSFLPRSFRVEVSAGQVHDWGTLVLEAGTEVSGVIEDSSGNPISNVPVLAYQSLARNLPPLRTLTNNLGVFTFDDLDSRIRFYDFQANQIGDQESLSSYSSNQKTMTDITKSAQISNIVIRLQSLSGSIQGQLTTDDNGSLVAAFGQYEGLNGATVLVTPRGKKENFEFATQPNGSFQIFLPSGLYDLEFLAHGYVAKFVKGVNVSNTANSLGTISLVSGTVIDGTIRNANGTLPTKSQVDQILAMDSSNNLFRAHLILESITETVDRFEFPGLAAGTYKFVAVDELGRLIILDEDVIVSNQDATIDLTFAVTEPKLVASFIQKLPDGVEAIFSCNQAYRNKPDDLDNDLTPDDDEFENFVSITRGNGTLAFNSVSADRQKAAYTYTRGATEGSSMELAASFRTGEINPATGNNFTVTGTFAHPFGLQSQQENVVTNLGGEFVLPSGSEFSLPENWSSESDLDGTLIRFQAADTLEDVSEASQLSAGSRAMELAEKLGPAAYPSRMYKAIRALASAPDVDPFSSFYDIFLPAGVSHVFSLSNQPTLTLRYDKSVSDPYTLNVYYFHEEEGIYTIENNNRRIDTENHTISVDIGHASVFTVLASSQSIIRGDANTGELKVFNFPNPFDLNSKTVSLQNPGSNSASQTIDGTMIKVSLPSDLSGQIKIEIFTVMGEKIKTIEQTASDAGAHYYLEWDGRNESGEQVASGVYFGRLTVGGGNERFFKMAMIK